MLGVVNSLLIAALGYGAIVLASVLVAALVVALGKSRLWMPLLPDLVAVEDNALSAQELAVLGQRGQELAALGFRPTLTYRMINWARPVLARIWLDPTGTIVCSADIMATSRGWEARFLSIESYGAGDAAVTTRNLPTVSVFDAMPMKRTRDVVEARTAEALLSAHRAAVAEAGLLPLPQEPASFFDEIVRRHRSFCEFQEQRGLLRRDEERARWVGTLPAHARSVFGQLLPSAADFEPSRLIRAALIGTVLPAALVLWSYSQGGAFIALSQAVVLVSGFVASVFFTARAWPWALILGALPMLLGPWTGPGPAYALFFGALLGNFITLRRKGLVATLPSGRRWLIRWAMLWVALVVLFFVFFSVFSTKSARRQRSERTTTDHPSR